MTDATGRLRRPFDQFQRYQVTADLLTQLGVGRGATVADVGGGIGPAEQFFDGYDVTVIDFDQQDVVADRTFVTASGAGMPFRDRSFDAVVSHDTLEHVPPRVRPLFLAELGRVARQALILCAPFEDPLVMLAEEALREFINTRFGARGPSLEFLDEHHEYGLPDLSATVGLVAESGWATATLPSGYLPRWLAAMLVQHELMATGLPELDRLNEFYNTTISTSDRRAPSYRHVVVAARNCDPGELQKTVDGLRSWGDEPAARTSVLAIAGAVFSHRLQAALLTPVEELKRQSSELHDTVAVRERELADRDAHLVELRQEISGLEHELHEVRLSFLAEMRRPLPSVMISRLRDLRTRWKATPQ